MAISTILREECQVCKKLAIEKTKTVIGDTVLIELMCGHMLTKTISTIKDEDKYNIVFSDGKSPRPYQIEAVKFGERAGFNFIIADEQGLGKTIEILTLIKLHAAELLPCIITCPTTVKLQILREIHRICIPDNTKEQKKRFLTQVIHSSKEQAMPGFQIYVVTYDLIKNPDMFALVPDIKLIVMDECQRIKNHLSERAKAVQKIAKNIPYRIPMSGTPIKNNAGEYFTVLNLVAPTRFPQYQRFLDTYCDTYGGLYGTKVGGLRDPQAFKHMTEDIIIRRKKEEVLKDLPSKERKFFHVEMDPKMNKAYAAGLKDLEELMYSDESGAALNASKIAIMGRLRHIVGLSKVDDAVEFAEEFLESSDRKLTIFVHHQDVGALLQIKLDELLKEKSLNKVLMLTSSLSAEARQQLIDDFRLKPSSRILIASTLAAGEALNLQFCSDAVMLERQWNPPNEVQAEDRFHRFGQENHVSITYMIGAGTIDDYFTELVESKRALIAATMDNESISWDQNSLMNELAEALIKGGKKKWVL